MTGHSASVGLKGEWQPVEAAGIRRWSGTATAKHSVTALALAQTGDRIRWMSCGFAASKQLPLEVVSVPLDADSGQYQLVLMLGQIGGFIRTEMQMRAKGEPFRCASLDLSPATSNKPKWFFELEGASPLRFGAIFVRDSDLNADKWKNPSIVPKVWASTS